jgi:hypothetical protein
MMVLLGQRAGTANVQATGRMSGFGIQTSAIAAMGTTGGPYLQDSTQKL